MLGWFSSNGVPPPAPGNEGSEGDGEVLFQHQISVFKWEYGEVGSI